MTNYEDDDDFEDDDFDDADFEDGTCPECGSDDVDEDHNLLNAGFLGGAGYFLDFPFGKEYHCNECGTERDGCFVATVVYGDAHAYEVDVVRRFRDDVLREHALGRKFIDWYYSGAGKNAARFIREETPGIIPVIRKGLDAIVAQYGKKQD